MIENFVFYCLIGFFGFLIVRALLVKNAIKAQIKRQFFDEYLDVLNNPKYKIKRKCDQ